METLLISGNTMTGWDIDEILSEPIRNSLKREVEKIEQYTNDNKIGPCCQGFTYYEIEQLERLAIN